MMMLADLSSTSPAAAGTVAGLKVAPDPSADVNCDLSRYKAIKVFTDLQGATGGTLDVYLQLWDGEHWVDWAHWTQLAGGAGHAKTILSESLATSSAPIVVGSDASPTLGGASAAFAGGHPGDRLRVIFVAGSGTTAGALQTIRIFGADGR